MISQESVNHKFMVCLTIIFLIIPNLNQAQSLISAQLSDTDIEANQQLELTFSIEQEIDFYFFSVEVLFDETIFEFIEIETIGLSSNGLVVADMIEPGKLGASVSLTEQMEAPDKGAIMKLLFNVQSKAPIGTGSFLFANQELSDSTGEDINTDSIVDSGYTVNESVGEVTLTMDPLIVVTEGDEFNATAKIYAAGVTDDFENESRIRSWVGIINENTDPALWTEENWQLMEFVEKDQDDYFTYTAEVAYMRPEGNWYVAIRSDLDSDEDYKYGGTGEGLWEDDSGILTIETPPPFRYTIAEWDFDDENRLVSKASPENLEAEIEIIGAEFSGYSAGASGQAKNSNSWDGFAEGENYWQVNISTKNFENLKLSSKQYGSSTGPRDFKLQTSTDGSTWNDVSGGEITVSNNWTSGVLESLPLPEELNDLDDIYIRWVQTSDFRINGEEGVSSAGTNRIDDIVVTGTNVNVESIEIWPGDTNNDGVVDELDLLPIGQYWLSEGPQPIYNSISWAARSVETWIPQAAAFADANGSGRVDHNDLQPIGLNFGKSRSSAKSEDHFDIVAQYEIDRLEMCDTLALYLIAQVELEISGFSLRMKVEGIDPGSWSVVSVNPMEWGEDWVEENRMLRFEIRNSNFHAATMVHKGKAEPVWSDQLVRVVIRAEETWLNPATVQVIRAGVSSDKNTYMLKDVYLTDVIDGDREISNPEIPSTTQLMVNYPNPFNPVTVIPYALSETGDVRIDIFDTIGRRVTSIFREAQQPGEYTINFDGSSLSSGVYIYRLKVNNFQQTKMMTLVK